jgi:glycosyltransferase involved in cell wall biosynthesis
MKILFFINGIYLGGKERRLVELMKEIKLRQQFEFELVVMNPEINYREIFDLKIKIHYLIRKTKKDLSVFLKFYKICKDYKPDVIHCWDGMTAIYSIPACRLLNIKLMNGMVVSSPSKRNILNKNWLRAKLAFPFSNIIIGNSKAGLQAYKAPLKKSFVVYNGYNFNRNERLLEKKIIRQQLNIHTQYIIGMVATFSESKDYKTYYQAADIVLRKRNDVTFLAIGNNTDSPASKMMVDGEFRNHFRLLGKKSGIESFINAIDIGVLATFTEGISNSIMEYMALGKPVIATSGGGTNEIVEDNKTGFLVKTSDAEELANRMEFLLNNAELRIQMGLAGKERVRNIFPIDKMIKKYISFYERLVNNKGLKEMVTQEWAAEK